ncbi:LIS1 homology motif protein, partial [Tanacetum coccineum]
MIAHAISHANSELLNEFLKFPKDASESWLSVKMALKQIAVKSRAHDYTYKEMLQQINDLEAASGVAFFDKFITSFAYTFEGHEAPVYSVVDYDAPGHSCTRMAYSVDGIRVFSCGTSKEGEAHLVEWNESEGAIEREYSGFKKRSIDEGLPNITINTIRDIAEKAVRLLDKYGYPFDRTSEAKDLPKTNLSDQYKKDCLNISIKKEGKCPSFLEWNKARRRSVSCFNNGCGFQYSISQLNVTSTTTKVSDQSSCTIDTVALTRNAEGGYTSQQPRLAVRGDNVPEAARQENENAPLG